jgi:hypothetical protein
VGNGGSGYRHYRGFFASIEGEGLKRLFLRTGHNTRLRRISVISFDKIGAKGGGYSAGKRIPAALALLPLALVLACRWGPDPKALARKSWELSKKALEALSEPGLGEELMKRVADIKEKAAALPERGRKIYEEELARLEREDLERLLGEKLDAAERALDAGLEWADSAAGRFPEEAEKALEKAQKNMEDALEAVQKKIADDLDASAKE